MKPYSLTLSLALVVIPAGLNAQNAVATSNTGQTTALVPHQATVTFVATNANNVQGAAKKGAISGAAGGAVTPVAAKAIPVPVAGGLIAQQAVGRILKAFNRPKPIKGFNVAVVEGLSAGTALHETAISFTVPAQALHGASAMLLRLKPSAKDSARIVRGVHLSTKDGTVNSQDAKILGVDQDAVACRQEMRKGDAVLIPKSPLKSGEYAIVLVPAKPDRGPVAGTMLWDFRR
jgi:hypothetical protein